MTPFSFKNKKDKELFVCLNPILIMIYADLFVYTKDKYNVNLVITDTISTQAEDAALGRVSPAHRQGRALDIRTMNSGLDTWEILDIINYINNKWAYKKYHYVAHSGEKRLAYWHGKPGVDEHIHLSIHAKFSASPLLVKKSEF